MQAVDRLICDCKQLLVPLAVRIFRRAVASTGRLTSRFRVGATRAAARDNVGGGRSLSRR